MTTRKRQGYLQAVLFAALLNAAGVFLSVGYAQVTTNITSSGLGTTVSQAGPMWNITGGTRSGSNLFHSFGSFNIGANNTANFCNAATCGVAQPLVGIQNILGRVTGNQVTGNQVSNIFGTIQTTMGFGTANLFLMNPAGWIFGPTAQLNIGGSFHATTANYIKLGTGDIFYADPTKESALTSAPPSAFGFLTANPNPINVQAGVFSGNRYTSVLQVPVRQTLSFVGGPVNVGASGQPPAGAVRAPGGRVNLVSVASAGEAAFDGTGFSVDSLQQLGRINITGGAIVDGKDVFIRGGELVITNATIFPGYFASKAPVAPLNNAPQPTPGGGEVNINVTNGVTITGTAPSLITQNTEFGIQTFAGVQNATFTGASANVPNVTINAGSFLLSGPQRAGIRTVRSGPGTSPLVTITADTVEVRNGAFVTVQNLYSNSLLEGAGGIVINARDVTLSSDGNSNGAGLSAQGFFNTLYSFIGPPPGFSFTKPQITLLSTADSGSITINATGKLTMLGRATAATDSFSFGKGGNVTINAGDLLLIGEGANTGGILAQSLLAGSSGNVAINATGAIDIQNGFRVAANTGGSGNAGEVNLTAASITATGADTRIQSGTGQSLDDDLQKAFFPQTFNTFFTLDPRFRTSTPNYPKLRATLGVPPHAGDLMDVLKKLNDLGLTNLADFTPGDGGKVIINNTPVLTLDAGARIETSTLWDGKAGAIIGDVGSLFVKGGASIRSRSGGERSDGIFVGTGSAGDVTFTASDTISISGADSTISTTTFGNGDAGSISLSANQVNVQNGGSVTSESGGTLASQFFVGSGNAGEINVSTPTLTMTNGSAISVKTSGAGNAGNISLLNVANFTQSGGARVDSSTTGAGSGGDITVTAANSASISGPGTGLFSTASSTGAGGNINLQAPQVQIVDGAIISANSTGTATATAGNVNIVTSNLNMQNGSITTEAALALGGNITITTTGSLVHLTDSEITTSVHGGGGKGGDITIDSDLVILDDSRILANAFGGPGGNINITADVFLVNSGGILPTSLDGIVEASSARSTPGTINIQATFTDVTGEVAQLPETPLRATELLRAACAARFAGGKASSLVLGGRDGVPLQPGGLMPSPLYLASEADAPAAGAKISGQDLPLRFSLLGFRDPRLTQYSLLPNAKCAF
jgi:filamentous hemagglutinin family protein